MSGQLKFSTSKWNSCISSSHWQRERKEAADTRLRAQPRDLVVRPQRDLVVRPHASKGLAEDGERRCRACSIDTPARRVHLIKQPEDMMRVSLRGLYQGCLVQVGNDGIELEAVGFQFEPYRWRPCGVTWDPSRTVGCGEIRP